MKNKHSLALLTAGLMMAACSTSPAPTATPETMPEPTASAEPTTVDYRDIDVQQLAKEGMKLTCASVYGVYNQEGDSVDSSIAATVYVNDETKEVVFIDFVEALLPVSAGGADGWAILDDEKAEALGGAVITAGEKRYPAAFELNGLTWTASSADDQVVYTASVHGKDVEFIADVATQEGGAWYHEGITEPAQLLDSEGKPAAEIQIGTKASIHHGVDFWPSPITFPGNIELIKNYVYDHGVNYGTYPESTDIAKNDAGEWTVADVTTGATLAGAPNYFNLIKQAYDQIESGQGTPFTAE